MIAAQAAGQPVIPVDTKKKVLVGNDNSAWHSADGNKWTPADAKGLSFKRILVVK